MKPITTWEYIRDLFSRTETVAIILFEKKTGTTGSATQRIVTAARAANPDFQRWLRAENAHGANVAISMNPLRPEAKGRLKSDIAEVRHLYLDLDEGGTKSLDRVLNDSRLPKPNYVLDTSPGHFQVIWKVRGFNQESAEASLRLLARHFGGDPAAVDVTRVMRLPGLHNKKYEQTYPITATRYATATYTPADFSFLKDRRRPKTPVSQPHLHQAPVSGQNSRSEQDWAHGCRVIAEAVFKGHNIETVYSRLEQHFKATRGDKPNPRYYAHKTVEKLRYYMGTKTLFASRPIGKKYELIQ